MNVVAGNDGNIDEESISTVDHLHYYFTNHILSVRLYVRTDYQNRLHKIKKVKNPKGKHQKAIESKNAMYHQKLLHILQ